MQLSDPHPPLKARIRRAVNRFAIENGIPGGGNGLLALGVCVPILAYLGVRYLGFVTFIL